MRLFILIEKKMSEYQVIPKTSDYLLFVKDDWKELYEVDKARKTCTCPDFKYRQHKCKHLVMADKL